MKNRIKFITSIDGGKWKEIPEETREYAINFIQKMSVGKGIYELKEVHLTSSGEIALEIYLGRYYQGEQL